MEISHTDSDSPQPALSNDSTTPVPPLPSDQVAGVFPSRDTVTLAHNGTNSSALPEDSTFTTRPSPHVNNSQTVLRNFFEQNANDRFLRWFRPSRNTRQVTSHGASNTLPSMQQTSTPTDTLFGICIGKATHCWGLAMKSIALKGKKRGHPGLEPGTPRTLSENHNP
ncbi:hypothetical protein BDV3_004864 [Batrachochytrium dendrobatidis]